MNRLTERLRTALQDPRTGGTSVLAELRAEVQSLRSQNACLLDDALIRENIIREQRELLRQAKPCPACVAKGE